MPTLANVWFGETIDGLAEALATGRYQLLLGQSHYAADEEEWLVNAFNGRNVEAVVLTGVRCHFGFIGAEEDRALKRLAGFLVVVEAAGVGPVEIEGVQPPSSIADGARELGRRWQIAA